MEELHISFKNNEQEEVNKRKLCIKNKEKIGEMCLLQIKLLYLLLPGKHRWVASGDSCKKTKY